MVRWQSQDGVGDPECLLVRIAQVQLVAEKVPGFLRPHDVLQQGKRRLLKQLGIPLRVQTLDGDTLSCDEDVNQRLDRRDLMEVRVHVENGGRRAFPGRDFERNIVDVAGELLLSTDSAT